MKAFALFGLVATATILLGGCKADYYAQRIVIPDASTGRISENLVGPGDQLVRQKRIALSRQFMMPDGTPIDVWVVNASPWLANHPDHFKPLGTVVILHGLCESKAAYLGIAQRLSKSHYDVVLIDLRAHGRSGGKYITYGALEKQDVKLIVDTLQKENILRGDNIYAFGTTLGGATAIQYAAIEPRCKAVMAISPYKDAASIARRIIFFFAPTMSEGDFQTTLANAGKLAGFNPAEASAVTAAGKTDCTLLLVHGLLDLSVPIEHSQAIYDAAKGTKKFVLITPGPEQVALAMIWEDWIAQRIEQMALGNLEAPLPTTQPTTGATTRSTQP